MRGVCAFFSSSFFLIFSRLCFFLFFPLRESAHPEAFIQTALKRRGKKTKQQSCKQTKTLRFFSTRPSDFKHHPAKSTVSGRASVGVSRVSLGIVNSRVGSADTGSNFMFGHGAASCRSHSGPGAAPAEMRGRRRESLGDAAGFITFISSFLSERSLVGSGAARI